MDDFIREVTDSPTKDTFDGFRVSLASFFDDTPCDESKEPHDLYHSMASLFGKEPDKQ